MFILRIVIRSRSRTLDTSHLWVRIRTLKAQNTLLALCAFPPAGGTLHPQESFSDSLFGRLSYLHGEGNHISKTINSLFKIDICLEWFPRVGSYSSNLYDEFVYLNLPQ